MYTRLYITIYNVYLATTIKNVEYITIEYTAQCLNLDESEIQMVSSFLNIVARDQSADSMMRATLTPTARAWEAPVNNTTASSLSLLEPTAARHCTLLAYILAIFRTPKPKRWGG